MIHGLRCRGTSNSCTTAVSGRVVRLLSRAGGHRGRLLNQALVDQQLHFDATVLCAAGARGVLGNRMRLAVAIRSNDASQRDVVVLNQIPNDVVRATLAQRAISLNAAGSISKTR